MNRIFAALALAVIPFFAVAAPEGKPPMKVFAPVTRADENLDFLSKVPPNTALIPTAAALYKKRPRNLRPLGGLRGGKRRRGI